MTYSAAVLADAPVAYYRLGESSGLIAEDSSGNNRDGSNLGTPTLGATGLLVDDADTSYSFDGVDDRVSIADAAWQDVTFISVECLISPGDLVGFQSFVDRDNNGPGAATDRAFQFRLNATKVEFLIWNTAGSLSTLLGNTVLVANNTYHVVATWDGVTSKIYVNGVLDNSVAFAGVGVRPITGPLLIGANQSANPFAQPFFGEIDEVAYYDYALTLAQIETHYNESLTPTAPEPSERVVTESVSDFIRTSLAATADQSLQDVLFTYWSGLSGLVPAEDYSLTDHCVAAGGRDPIYDYPGV